MVDLASKLNTQNKPLRQKILDVLGMEWPFSVKKIYERLVRQHSVSVTYQAVHKTLKGMQSEGVLEKVKDGYQISLDWLRKSKSNLESVENRYVQSKKIIIPKDFVGNIVIEFDSMTDLAVSVTELLTSRQLVEGSSSEGFICTLEYGWFPFKFRFEHLGLIARMCSANKNAMNIIRKKTPFGEWVRGQYSKAGGISAPLGLNVGIDEDLFIQGDYLIEVKFDDKTRALFDKFYNKWGNISGAFIEFGLKEEPKINAVVQITKNKELASYFRKKLEKYFEK